MSHLELPQNILILKVSFNRCAWEDTGCCFLLKHPAYLSDVTKRGEYGSKDRKTLVYT